ncbi:hypothetical protein [Aestuariivirga sp.]|uniref:hypothetical protein n=1 Tax=Aestuariivirga sp. TaxID=2650926 RepID=UPI00391CDBE4
MTAYDVDRIGTIPNKVQKCINQRLMACCGFQPFSDLHSAARVTMKRHAVFLVAALASAVVVSSAARADSDPDMIKSAESAAPSPVSTGATIYAMNDKGEMRTLREGNNGWWCMPDTPSSPGPDPMCGDANSMEWAMAWISQKEPPKGKVGFIYMMAGGSDASNTDPYALGPADGNNWVSTPPHVMIVNATDMMAGYPSDANPDTSRPYIMWPNTPYAHLMIPVN